MPPGAADLLEDLLAELVRWNRRIRLTAPAPLPELAVRLIDDALLLLPFLKGSTLIDVGSGPGIPGLPLAIARPQLRVRTVEAIGKKVAFTRAFLARHPTLSLEPFQGRAEGRADEPWGKATTVLSRAFTSPAAWVRIGAPLVAPGGRLLVLLGTGSGDEADEVARGFGLSFAGTWTGSLAGARRALRWYDRPDEDGGIG